MMCLSGMNRLYDSCLLIGRMQSAKDMAASCLNNDNE